MVFGYKLRHERIQKGLSQEELGKLVNKTKNNISQYELGKREPDNETLKMFAEIFDCSIDYLLDHNQDNCNDSETKTCPNLNVDGLPEEAIQQINEYIDFIRLKYNPDGNLRK